MQQLLQNAHAIQGMMEDQHTMVDFVSEDVDVCKRHIRGPASQFLYMSITKRGTGGKLAHLGLQRRNRRSVCADGLHTFVGHGCIALLDPAQTLHHNLRYLLAGEVTVLVNVDAKNLI